MNHQQQNGNLSSVKSVPLTTLQDRQNLQPATPLSSPSQTAPNSLPKKSQLTASSTYLTLTNNQNRSSKLAPSTKPSGIDPKVIYEERNHRYDIIIIMIQKLCVSNL